MNVKSTYINLTQLFRRSIGDISFQERGERLNNTTQSVLDAIRLKKAGFLPGLKVWMQYFRKKIRFLGDRASILAKYLNPLFLPIGDQTLPIIFHVKQVALHHVG
ncbi:hypothetical protein QUB63_11650 [Microcoleus sp. ARI1-B5]|uniref:hypothetical protein n=1 Tax=unclassified Microcoleus TaxID=2642155 RepID=UPI002FD08B93